MIARAVALACLALGMRLPAQAVHLRNVSGTGGIVSVGSVNDTVWLSIRPANGDLFTIRADTATMAAWADSPALITDQAIAFVPLPPDSSVYFVRGVLGTQRDSIQLSADSARAVFAAMHGATPGFTPSAHAFLRFQVKRGATLIHGTRVPEYPESLRSNNMGGVAWARFVVDSTGRVDTHSITIVSSTHPQISQAIQSGLKETRFQPAQIDGRNVAEVVDMEFRFFLPANLDIEPMDRP
ncbi:MAG TPA: TonB family protein [Gemmatimonadaceae bacterium]|nr:TonB family protein [Gemmatimonadaceae bacterium]